MDRGDLVPDEVIVGVIAERISQPEAADGFILDGFPRTLPQAEALDAKMAELGRELTAVILIDVVRGGDRAAAFRQAARARTATSSTSSSTRRRTEGVCDVCGEPLAVRDDDKPEVVRHRLDQYREKNKPLINYYEQRGPARAGRGRASPEEVADRIRALLATLRMEEEA